jgi:hypothetical protein
MRVSATSTKSQEVSALEQLNPALLPGGITAAVDGCSTVENLKMS